jgi:hypothetical protein
VRTAVLSVALLLSSSVAHAQLGTGAMRGPATFPHFPNGTNYVVVGGWTLGTPFASPFLMVPVCSPF